MTRHTVVVVTVGADPAAEWQRVRGAAAERGEAVSAVVVDGSRAIVVVPPGPARLSPVSPTFPAAAAPPDAAVWEQVVDLIGEADEIVGATDPTEVHLVGTGSSGVELRRLLAGASAATTTSTTTRRPARASPQAAPETLRLVKVARRTVMIVEVPVDGGDGIEYSPWADHDTWGARLTWTDDRSLRIDVGDYSLSATALDGDVFAYRGSETGPWGETEFDVFGVTSDPADLPRSTVREYLRLVEPRYEYDEDRLRSNLKAPPMRTVKVADAQAARGVLPDRAGVETTVDQPMDFRGIQGGDDVRLTIKTFPTAARPQVQVRTSHDHHFLVSHPASFGRTWFQLLPAR